MQQILATIRDCFKEWIATAIAVATESAEPMLPSVPFQSRWPQARREVQAASRRMVRHWAMIVRERIRVYRIRQPR